MIGLDILLCIGGLAVTHIVLNGGVHGLQKTFLKQVLYQEVIDILWVLTEEVGLLVVAKFIQFAESLCDKILSLKF